MEETIREEAISIENIEFLLADLVTAQLDGHTFELVLTKESKSAPKATNLTTEVKQISTIEVIQIFVGLLTVLVLISQLVKK